MRVLLINKLYYPHVGGVESHVRILAKGLRNRVDVRVLCAGKKPRTWSEQVDGIEVTRLANLYGGLSAPLAPAFLWELPDGKSDIQHVHFPSGLPEVALARGKASAPIVVTYHSDVVRQKYLEKFFRPFSVALLEKADRIIVGSPNLIERSPLLNKVKEKCVVIPFGVEPENLAMDREGESAVEGIRTEHPGKIVFFLGRLIYYKGIDYLIKAMSEVDATLLIGGTGPLEGELRRLARELGVEQKVVFLGSVPKELLAAYYQACDLFVLPSIAESEAYGLVQVEAHMCGKPVVSTNLPTGVPYVNQHEVTGLVVPPEDDRALGEAINRLLLDDELRISMGERARARAFAEFTAESMVKSTIKVYEDVLEERSR